MKLLLACTLFLTFSQAVFAQPGSHKLVCNSAKNSGSVQKIELSLKRANALGLWVPVIEVNVNDKKIEMTTPDDMKSYGTTFHNSPLKVITVTAEVEYDVSANTGFFSVVAIPKSVKAFDIENKPAKWSLEKEKDECHDANGRATFQAIIHGYLHQEKNDVIIDTQILDCELTYNSGSAC